MNRLTGFLISLLLLHFVHARSTITISTSSKEPTTVTSGQYTFTNVKEDLIYVFQHPENFTHFFLRVEVDMPIPIIRFGKLYSPKLFIVESDFSKITMNNVIVGSYNYTNRDLSAKFNTSRRHLIVIFKPALKTMNSGKFLTITITASNAMDDVGECSRDTFKCSPSEEMCLIKDARCDGVQNCPNGFDETNCIDKKTIEGKYAGRAVTEVQTKEQMYVTWKYFSTVECTILLLLLLLTALVTYLVWLTRNRIRQRELQYRESLTV